MNGHTNQEILAIYGGTPIRTRPFPTVNDASGHLFSNNDLAQALETLKSGRWNYTSGTQVTSLEREFASLFGIGHCVASSSGTAALHIAFGALGIGSGDEVIVPPITDIGTVIGILYQRATPVFADIDPETFTLDPTDVARKVTGRTRGIVTVHLLGNACDMNSILQVARKHDIAVIEDCAQAYYTKYQGRLVGTFGSFGCFSLQQSKHITSGDGGLTITNNADLATSAKLFSDKGWQRPLYADVMFLAPNYRMPEISAALVLDQLSKLGEIVQRRQRLAYELNELISNIPGVLPPIVRRSTEHSYWQYAILLDRKVISTDVYRFGEAVKAEGIPCLPGYTRKPMYAYPIFCEKRFDGPNHSSSDEHSPWADVSYQDTSCPNAEQVLKDVIVFPWNEMYSMEDVQDIARALTKVTKHFSAFS
jgi:dTDP-4-amino-4,6-dideoxygalactose transaminase